MIKPRRLKQRDRIRVVAPASPVKPEMFEQGITVIKELGFEPVFKDPFQKWRYLAGKDSHRKAELLEALQDHDSSAIFLARGGYGCSRLIPDKDFEQSFTPKILLGCSDITTLHLYFQKIHNWVVFHGPMPSGDFSRGQLHKESLLLATTSDQAYQLSPPGVECLKAGDAEGILAGGCLTLLDASLGTQWEPVWDDTILFLEDVSVKPYQVDRMLMHLIHKRKFDGVRAFFFGEMKDCVQVENQGYSLQEVIMDILGPLGKPIYFGFPSGHVSGFNWTIPLGVRARISSKPQFLLEILEGAVERGL
jgi:muramoyltetrapeptide carboxypeptidase